MEKRVAAHVKKVGPTWIVVVPQDNGEQPLKFLCESEPDAVRFLEVFLKPARPQRFA